MNVKISVVIDSTAVGALAALASSLEGELSAEECNETLSAIEWVMDKFYSDPNIIPEISEEGLKSLRNIVRFSQSVIGWKTGNQEPID